VSRFASSGARPLLSEEALYLRLMRYFDRMADDLGGRLMALNSLYFVHHVRTGLYTTLGSETAQGLPNAQLFYAFLRSAARQYAARIWGNASIYNRWGFKTCTNTTSCSDSGTSLALLNRLIYTEMSYNAIIFGYEGSMTVPAAAAPGAPSHAPGKAAAVAAAPPLALSPIGQLQAHARQVQQQLGTLGVFLPTVAVLLDAFAGFTPPRHLYTSNLFRTYGSRPFSTTDFWAHAVFDLLYPGYADASYYHDERGFLAPTPYGDIVDVLHTDATDDTLALYSVVIVAGKMGAQRRAMHDRLQRFATAGGAVVVAADALRQWAAAGLAPAAMTPVDPALPPANVAPNATVTLLPAGQTLTEPYAMAVTRLPSVAPPGTQVLATVADGLNVLPLAWSVPVGKGRVVILATSGVASEAAVPLPLPEPPSSAGDWELPEPYPRLAHVGALVSAVLWDNATLFAAGPTGRAAPGAGVQPRGKAQTVGDEQPLGLSVTAARRSPGNYTLIIANNALTQQPLSISTRLGLIKSLSEVMLNTSARTCGGYTPEYHSNASLGHDTPTTIAGLSVRVFIAEVEETNAVLLPPPADRQPPKGRGLAINPAYISADGAMDPVREAVYLRPLFAQQFDTMMLDWRVVEQRTDASLQRLGIWLGRQRLHVVVDCRSGINLYPELRFTQNSPDEYADSLVRVTALLDKMLVINTAASNASGGQWPAPAAQLLLTGHTPVENYYTPVQEATDLLTTLANLTAAAGARGNMSVLLAANSAGVAQTEALVLAAVQSVRAKYGLTNLYVAPTVARLLAAGINSGAELEKSLPGLTQLAGLWLAAAPERDALTFVEAGYNGRLATTDPGTSANACALLKAAGSPPGGIIFDADISAGESGAVGGDNAVRRLEDAEYLEAEWLAECLGE
jgi:hypothetical protein